MSAGRAPSTEQRASSTEAMAKRMIDRTGRRMVLGAAVAILAALTAADVAESQSADCARLRQAISDASRNDQGAQYQAAADRQRAEIDRTVAYARSIGCDRKQFLFFGWRRPPNAARSTRRSGACAPISTNCSHGPAAAQAGVAN